MKKITTALFALALTALTATAESFPEKTIKMIVPYPPGTGTDTLARYVGKQLENKLGQTVLVENKVGASGIIAAQAVVGAVPDGYTLLFSANAPVATNVAAFAALPYDPLTDLTPVALLAQAPMGVFVAESSAVRSIADLVTYASDHPGKLNYGSGSATYQIATEWFLALTNIRANHISYKGAGPALNDLAGQQLDFVIAEYSGGLALLQAKKLRLLAVTINERLATAPEVPTVQEAGYKDFFKVAWWALFAPSKTPAAVVQTLQDAVLAILAEAETKNFMTKMNFIPTPAGSVDLKKFQQREIDLEKATVAKAGIQKE